MTESLLSVVGIDVFYGPIQALRSLSLEVRTGEMVALVGANGAGKTTTLRSVSGMIHPRAGSIVFDGEDVTQFPPHALVARGLTHLPEGRELFSNHTVEENLQAGYWVRRRHRAAYAEERDRVMEHFPILRERAGQHAGTLSGGEQQMLAVARALMSSPKLLVVDELSLGLAPKVVSTLFEVLRDVNAAGTAVVIVEQFVHMALANTTRAYVLAKGEVALEGRSSELLADPKLIASYLGEAAPASTNGRGARARRKSSGTPRRGAGAPASRPEHASERRRGSAR